MRAADVLSSSKAAAARRRAGDSSDGDDDEEGGGRGEASGLRRGFVHGHQRDDGDESSDFD